MMGESRIDRQIWNVKRQNCSGTYDVDLNLKRCSIQRQLTDLKRLISDSVNTCFNYKTYLDIGVFRKPNSGRQEEGN